jgi:hypothetical protein
VLFLKRTKRVEWDADYRDENNRIQYWLDGHSLRRRHIVSGSVVSEIKQPVPDGSSYTFQIELRPDRVTVRGASGELIDEVKRTAPVALGKFGFRGEVALAIQKFEER